MEMFRLMEGDSGYFVTHTTGLTEQEARKELKTYSDLYPNQEWYIEPYDDSEEGEVEKEVITTPRDACDGWEDIYPYDY